MIMRFAVLCPGQGGQHARMFDMLPSTRRQALFDEWRLEAALGMPLQQALEDAHLFANRVAQPLVVAAAMAYWDTLRGMLPRPQLVLGYSAGELAAHGIAGACTPAGAVALSARRARLMDDCAGAGGQHGMLAVSGMRMDHLKTLLADRGLHVAIETGEDSAVVGGLRQDLQRLEELAAGSGARAQFLPVAVASHTPLMQPAAAAFASLLEAGLEAPRLPLLAGISGLQVRTRDAAVDTLARQVAETIRWADCMDACAEAGISVALELGPCPALSRMLHQRHPQIACRSVSDFRSPEAAAAWVERQG